MDIGHLHLHVRDRALAEAFYRRWFGLATKSADDAITFMTGDRGFLLALMGDPAPEPAPPWFHLGVPLDSASRVRNMLAAMRAAGVPIVKPLYEDDTFVSFRCCVYESISACVFQSGPAHPAFKRFLPLSFLRL
jgi:catechol 2,3-dioxygenase-like lactoylglutathione lyase family enzyme